jgi:N-formylglutamate amidohydrolase
MSEFVRHLAGTCAVVLDSPHSGTAYPQDFGHACDLQLLRRAEDTHVDRLYSFAPALGVHWVEALFPRSYLDANRGLTEIDESLLDAPWPGERPRSAAELAGLFERAGLPFAPIRRPEDLYDDPHLRATGGLADVVLPDGPKAGQTVKTALFPVTMGGQRLGVRLQPPRLGEHTQALLQGLGYGNDEIDALRVQALVA